MMETDKRKLIVFIILAIFLLFLIIGLFFVSPQELVDTIGVKNSYIILFVVSFFGGFSSGGSVTFISLLLTFAAGGMNPYHLALVSGISLALGDSIMFFTGAKGRELVHGKWEKPILKVEGFFYRREKLKRLIPLLAYLYMGFAPLPNDLLLLFLAAIEFPRRKMYLIILAGDISFAMMMILIGVWGGGLFS